MKNIEDINKAAVKKISANKKISDFSPGDTIKVGVKIIEGKKERVQFFEGVCIAKKIEISTLPSQCEKFHLVKVLRGHLHYIVQI
tara:strand:+ start:150 stop:404 length:255 start_codon:yes stop_codon:yes gene_type:complete